MVRSTASAVAERGMMRGKHAIGRDSREGTGFPRSRPSGAARGIMLNQERPGAIAPQYKTIALENQPAAASLSGKRRGNLSLTRVPLAPEANSSSAPQRAARLRMLRKPRATF